MTSRTALGVLQGVLDGVKSSPILACSCAKGLAVALTQLRALASSEAEAIAPSGPPAHPPARPPAAGQDAAREVLQQEGVPVHCGPGLAEATTSLHLRMMLLRQKL